MPSLAETAAFSLLTGKRQHGLDDSGPIDRPWIRKHQGPHGGVQDGTGDRLWNISRCNDHDSDRPVRQTPFDAIAPGYVDRSTLNGLLLEPC